MRFGLSYLLIGTLAGEAAANAQDRLNQADPSIVERNLPRPVERGQPAPTLPAAGPVASPPAIGAPRIASAIIIDGAPAIARATFSDAIMPFIGRQLSADDLAQLARAVADAARAAGYPLATAWIEPQSLAAGVLRVRIDGGEVTAVRVVGAINPVADRILSRTLVTGSPVRSRQLERAILLVGDLPGVTVRNSKYLRQNGFGILLVTIAEDHASAYAQFDNRGSKEIGPIRSTVLGNLRGVFGAGDELSVLGAQTPLQLREFAFVRARYSAPIDANGDALSASGSYGRTHPGASLGPLDVIGKSVDASVMFSKALLRARARSVWGELEFRGLRSKQSLLGSPLRNDRLATLTASLRTRKATSHGALAGELRMVTGLPLHGVTHEGALRSSRSDGDARFVTWGYSAEWVTTLTPGVSLALSSEGQIASRPLLATAEIGAGGPLFGRGYDYAERTGDNGLLGAAELRFDAGRVVPGVIDRFQIYASVDGGHVDNLRGGKGGGSLLSAAAGVRLGRGRLGAMAEIGLPLNKDRFDTGDRAPRISLRVSRAF